MKKKLLIFVLILSTKTYSQDSTNFNNIQLEWGNNIYGNTVSIGYKYGISNHLGVGLSIGKGFFQYKVGNNNKFLNFNNIPGADNIFSIDIKQIVSLNTFYRLNRNSSLKFLNYYELGISSINFVFRDQYKRENTQGIFVGEIIYNLYFLNMYLNFIEYKPKNIKDNVSFMFGISNYFSWLSSPQKISYYNGNLVEDDNLSTSNGKILLFYPQLCLRIIYSF